MSVVDLMDRPIAFNRAFVSLGIGINGALMLSQCVYWSTRTGSSDGWFYKTQGEWESETGLTRREQESARAKLVAKGYIREVKKGVPCKVHFQVDKKRLEADLLSMAETAKLDCTKATNQSGGERQTGMAETDKQECTNPPNSDGGNRQTITENTTKTTPEITSQTTSNAAARRATHKFSEADLQCAEWLYQKLREFIPDCRNVNTKTWAEHVRKMRELDNRDHKEICALWLWCRRDSFEAANVQSPEKLRKRYDQLKVKMRNSHAPASTAKPKSAIERIMQEHYPEHGQDDSGPLGRDDGVVWEQVDEPVRGEDGHHWPVAANIGRR